MFFLNSLAFLMIQRMLAIWSLVPLPFLKPAWTSGSSRFTYCWNLTSYLQEIDSFAEKTDIWTFPVLRTKQFRGPTLFVLGYLFPVLSAIRWQQSHPWTHQRKTSFLTWSCSCCQPAPPCRLHVASPLDYDILQWLFRAQKLFHCVRGPEAHSLQWRQADSVQST